VCARVGGGSRRYGCIWCSLREIELRSGGLRRRRGGSRRICRCGGRLCGEVCGEVGGLACRDLKWVIEHGEHGTGFLTFAHGT